MGISNQEGRLHKGFYLLVVSLLLLFALAALSFGRVDLDITQAPDFVIIEASATCDDTCTACGTTTECGTPCGPCYTYEYEYEYEYEAEPPGYSYEYEYEYEYQYEYEYESEYGVEPPESGYTWNTCINGEGCYAYEYETEPASSTFDYASCFVDYLC